MLMQRTQNKSVIFTKWVGKISHQIQEPRRYLIEALVKDWDEYDVINCLVDFVNYFGCNITQLSPCKKYLIIHPFNGLSIDSQRTKFIEALSMIR